VLMELQIVKEDPLLYDVDLPFRGLYHPLGFSVEIVTNSRSVLEAAQESWGHFRKVFFEPPVQLRIGVLEGDSKECPPVPTCRAWQHLLSNIADAQNFSVCDMRRGLAFVWLTQAAVENRGYLRYHFLEAAAWSLLTPLYLTPIHGACVRLGERGVLLCGDSGAGKSSLAYACARRGWTFLSDDSSHLVRKRHGRLVVGNPHQMRFRQSAIDIFPEFKDQRLTLRATGELAIELQTARLPEIQTTLECSVDFIVFLNRKQADSPGFWDFPKDEALLWFEQTICYGERELRESQKASLRNLMSAEVYELRYGNLDLAVTMLDALVRDKAPEPRAFCAESNGLGHA
jgi:hypothetical protein